MRLAVLLLANNQLNDNSNLKNDKKMLYTKIYMTILCG